MNNHQGQPGKLIYGSEILLIAFAAFLLAAAIPPKTIEADLVPVKVNMPAPDAATETLTTASVQITSDDQTTALLAIKEMPQIKITPELTN